MGSIIAVRRFIAGPELFISYSFWCIMLVQHREYVKTILCDTPDRQPVFPMVQYPKLVCRIWTFTIHICCTCPQLIANVLSLIKNRTIINICTAHGCADPEYLSKYSMVKFWGQIIAHIHTLASSVHCSTICISIQYSHLCSELSYTD